MQVNILAFGIVKDIFGKSAIVMDIPDDAEVQHLKAALEAGFPQLKQLASYMLAVNNNYADDGVALAATDEIAIIPPVSGG